MGNNFSVHTVIFCMNNL